MEPEQILIEWLKNRRYKILIILGLILCTSKIIDEGHFAGILAMYVSVAIGLTFYYIIAKLQSSPEQKNKERKKIMLETRTSTSKTLVGIDTALYNEFLLSLAGEDPTKTIEELICSYMNKEDVAEKKKATPRVNFSSMTDKERKLYDFILANGRSSEVGAFYYAHYHAHNVEKICGFDLYNETNPQVVKKWRDAFKEGRYKEINIEKKKFPSTVLDWAYKYLLENEW